MGAVVKDRKTGTDIDLVVTVETTAEILALFTQIILVYSYTRGGITKLISFQALDVNDPDLIAEAAEEGKTVHQLAVVDDTLQMVIPVADTEGLDLADNELVVVRGELSYTDGLGKEFKNADRRTGDPVAFNMIQSTIRGII